MNKELKMSQSWDLYYSQDRHKLVVTGAEIPYSLNNFLITRCCLIWRLVSPSALLTEMEDKSTVGSPKEFG